MSRINRAPGIGSGSFRSVQRFAEKNQINFESLLRQAGISSLGENPDLTISEEEQLIKALISKTHCSFSTGFSVGLSYEPVDLGMLGIASLTCNTLESTLAMCARYFQKAFHFTALELKQEPLGTRLYIRPVKGVSPSLAEYLIGRDVGIFSALLKQALGKKPCDFIEIGFALPFRSAMHRIGHLFGVNVRFKQSHNYILFDPILLKTAMPMPNHETSLALEYAMDRHLSLMDQNGLLQFLKRLLVVDLNNMPSMEDIAQKLNMSSRTLSRQIEKEGTSWRRLTTEIKLNAACELLRNSQKSLRVIAQETGFSGASSLCHSFVREKGCTPNQFREGNATLNKATNKKLQTDPA